MSFEDIKGQDSALSVLKEGIKSGRIFSSYLFVGPNGIGKKETAKNFAKAINCLDEKNKPCEACTSCAKINSDVHPDVLFVEPQGKSVSIGIDQIRSVLTKANLKPYEAKKKVFVINDAHTMSQEASNAFLKTLEEPPSDTVFILISRSEDLLLPTIVSRCHVIKFFAARPALVENFLIERFGTEKDKARILSSFSGGRIGEAVRLDEKGLIEKKNNVIDSMLGRGRELSEELGVYSGRDELKEKLEFIVSFLRDMFLYATVKDKPFIFHLDRLEDIKKECRKFTTDELSYLIKRTITLRSYIDYNVNSKIIVDVLCSELGDYYARGSSGKAP